MSNAINMRSREHHLYRAHLYMGLALRALSFADNPPVRERKAFVSWRNQATLDELIDAMIIYRRDGVKAWWDKSYHTYTY